MLPVCYVLHVFCMREQQDHFSLIPTTEYRKIKKLLTDVNADDGLHQPHFQDLDLRSMNIRIVFKNHLYPT